MAESQSLQLGPGVVLAGKYKLVERLGNGAMGVVYRAEDLVIGRRLAIKFVLRSAEASDAERTDEAERRFLREAQSAGALNHPNIVTIYDAGNSDGHTYIAMEFVEGGGLDRALSRQGGPMPVDEVCRWMIQACSGLFEAHRAGIVHRDIKPANLLLTRSGLLKISDFGLAKMQAHTSMLTQEGMVVGTVAYMAPEVLRHEPTDERVDQFAIGVVMYRLLTSVHPFEGITTANYVYNIVFQQPRPIRELNPEVPEALAAVIERSMAKTPGDRFVTLGEMAEAIAVAANLPGSQSYGVPSTLAVPAGPVPAARGAVAIEASPPRGDAPTSTGRQPPPAERGSSGFLAPPPRRRLAPLLGLLLVAFGGALLYWFRPDLESQAEDAWQRRDYELAAKLYLQLFETSESISPGVVGRLSELYEVERRTSAPKHKGTIRVLNWEDYIGALTTDLFTKRTGIGVEVVGYEDVDQIPALLAGPPFDVYILPEGMIRRYAAERRLEPLDPAKLPNLANLDPFFRNLKFDPGNRHSAPYLFNALALLYDPMTIRGRPESWGVLFDAEQAEGLTVGMSELPRELMGVALKYLNYPYDTIELGPVREAVELIRASQPRWKPLDLDVDTIAEAFHEHEIDLTMQWNGHAFEVMEQVPRLRVSYPNEGTNLSIDCLAIAKGSTQVELAHRFIDHVLDPRIGAELAMYNSSGSPNRAARALLSPASEHRLPAFEELITWDLDMNPFEALELWHRIQAEPTPTPQGWKPSAAATPAPTP